MSEPTTMPGLDVDTFMAGLDSPHHNDKSRRQWCALFVRDIGLLAAAAARTALLDELEAAVEGLEPTGDAGYYDDRWVNRAAVLAEINRRRP